MNYILIFLTGLFGSMHCVGMCGAVVAAYSTQQTFQGISRAGKLSQFIKHFSYNFGRVLSYVFVGALLGAFGGGFSGLQSAGEWFSTAAGALLVLSGIWMMRIFPWMGFKQEIALTSEKRSFLLSIYTKTYRRITRIVNRREQVLHRIADPAPAMRIALFNVCDGGRFRKRRERGCYHGAVWKRHCSLAGHCWICIDVLPYSIAYMGR